MARLILFLACGLLLAAPVAAWATPIVAAAAAGAAIGVGAGMIATGVAWSWAAFGAAFATNLAISVLSGLLTRKPSMPSVGDFADQARGRQVVIRSATEPRKIVYGEVSLSGPLTFACVSGESNQFLHLVIPLAGHECDSIPRVFLGDDEVGDLDASGYCTSGKFSGLVRVRKYLGTTTQEADPDLIAESGGLWTAAHQGLGVTYLYIRLRFQQDVFPNGIPNVRAIVRGKKLYDPRDGGTRWSPNWALAQRDYLAGSYGLDCDSTELNDASVIAAANICDEQVEVDGGSPRYAVAFFVNAGTDVITFTDATDPKKEKRFSTGDVVQPYSAGTLPTGLQGSPSQFYLIRINETQAQLASSYANALAGTAIALVDVGSGTHYLQHVSQARYTCNGVVNLADTPESIITAMVTAAMGAVVYQQGEYRIYAGAYRTPVMDLDEDSLNGGLVVKPRIARADLYNGVRGTYVDPARNWQATDFPPITNATYETQDGGQQILRDVQFPFTTDQIRAQRLAKIILERSRQSISVQMPCNLSVLKLAPWDTVRLTIDLLGWSSKVFLVMGWQFNETGGINLQLQEEASAVYDWNFGDATLVDPAPDTNLPDVNTIRRMVPARVAGLQIFGGEAAHDPDYDAWVFTGADAKVEWRRTALFGSYEFGAEQFGAGDGSDDFFLKDYEVRVYSGNVLAGVDNALRRTEYVVDPAYIYTGEKNLEDGAGTGERFLVIAVRQRTRYNQVSAVANNLILYKPPVEITDFAVTAIDRGFAFGFTCTDTAFADIEVHASLTSGFTPDSSTLQYKGSKRQGSVGPLLGGRKYYVKYIASDIFGASDASAQYEVTTEYAAGEAALSNWTLRAGSASSAWRDIAYAPEIGTLCAVASANTNRVMTSNDVINWTSRSASAAKSWCSVAWSPALRLFAAVDEGPSTSSAMTSPDGITWTSRTTPNQNWFAVIWVPELALFIAGGGLGPDNQIMTSPDGITWTQHALGYGNVVAGLAWSPTLARVIAVGGAASGYGGVFASTDGTTWSTVNDTLPQIPQRVAWSESLGLFAAVDQTVAGYRVITSPDGFTWTQRATPRDTSWIDIDWSEEIGAFVAVGNSGSVGYIMTSYDGITWTERTNPSGFTWNGVVWVPEFGQFVAVGNGGGTQRVVTSQPFSP